VRKRISRDQLGHNIGKSGQQIARYESGENIPSAVTLQKLASELECSPLDLLDGRGE
jgi:transcriptional regulator with XRE-family HTH domain